MTTALPQWDDFSRQREAMVDLLTARGIRDSRVLDAMRRVPRELFVPPGLVRDAYADAPLPIGGGQTISQPYIVALMLDALDLSPSDRVLDVGTGSGYQAALLGELVAEVVSIEVVPRLAREARALLERLGYRNVQVVDGDGSLGWTLGAPYDAIVVAAAAPEIPQSLVDQLVEGGRLVLPVGDPLGYQTLVRLRKRCDRVTTEDLCGCAFVPLIGAHGW